MSDPREVAYAAIPTATPEREAAWREWIDNYIMQRAAEWSAEGESRDDILKAAATILLDYGQIDGLPWMPIGEAMCHKLAAIFSDGKESEGQERIDFMLACRTLETVSEHEYTLAAAYHYGVSAAHAVKMLAGAVETTGSKDQEVGPMTTELSYPIVTPTGFPYGVRCSDCDRDLFIGDPYADRAYSMCGNDMVTEIVCVYCANSDAQ